MYDLYTWAVRIKVPDYNVNKVKTYHDWYKDGCVYQRTTRNTYSAITLLITELYNGIALEEYPERRIWTDICPGTYIKSRFNPEQLKCDYVADYSAVMASL